MKISFSLPGLDDFRVTYLGHFYYKFGGKNVKMLTFLYQVSLSSISEFVVVQSKCKLHVNPTTDLIIL